MYSFGFVVLHYKTYVETKETIDSILCLPTEGRAVKIIVVDNASENGSTEKLIRDYKDRENVLNVQLFSNQKSSMKVD